MFPGTLVSQKGQYQREFFDNSINSFNRKVNENQLMKKRN